MKKLHKKIGVVVLSGMLLSGAGLAVSSSVANAGSPSQIVSSNSDLHKAMILNELVDLSKENRFFEVVRSDFNKEASDFKDYLIYKEAKDIMDNIKGVYYEAKIDKILGIGWRDVRNAESMSKYDFIDLVKSGENKFHKKFAKNACYRLNIGGVRVIILVK